MLFKTKRNDINKNEIYLKQIYCKEQINNIVLNNDKLEDKTFKISPSQHLGPYLNTRNDMAVLTCLFNPGGSIRILQNYLTIANQMKASNIPFYTIELSSDDNYFTTKNIYNFHVISNSHMFFKENLLNVLSKKIPQRFTKLCFLDADIIFSDQKWYDKVSVLLNEYNIVQPFEYCGRLDVSFKLKGKLDHSCVTDEEGGHPGFVWASRRDFFENIGGFCDDIITGSGDSVFAQSFLISKNKGSKRWFDLNESPFKESIINYNKIVQSVINQSKMKTATHLNNCVAYHLFHGVIHKRDYQGRLTKFQIFVNNVCPGCDFTELLEINEYGIYNFKDKYREDANKFFLSFFFRRDDDGI